MGTKPAELRATVGRVDQIASVPSSPSGEIALVGRSNVGKSTLINTLAGARIARTSGTPGKTRVINFYRFGTAFDLVDLPGVGYARVSQHERKEWDRLITAYVDSREALRGFLMVMDARHPLSNGDAEAMAWIETTGLPYEIVLTKVDKLRQADRAAASRTIASAGEALAGARGVTYFSGLTGEGHQNLMKKIATLIAEEAHAAG